MFIAGIVATGVSIIAVASVSTLTPALFLTAAIGATAGSAYVTGFTLLQENVADELRGRTFATLYTVVRLCLLVALTVGPFVASALGAVSDAWVDGDVEVGSFTVSLPGVRLALWLGGVVTILAGFMARRRMRRVEPEAVPSEGDRMTGRFIVLEGGEGSRARARRPSSSSSAWWHSGATPCSRTNPATHHSGEEIRQLLLHREDAVDERAELLLMLADRAQHVATVVEARARRGMPSSCATGSRRRRSPTRASGARSGSKRSNG